MFMDKKYLLLTTLIIIIVLVASFFFYNKKSDYVIIINGNKISVGEFMLYFYEMQVNFEDIGGHDIWDTDFEGRTALEVAKERAINSIAHIKVTAQRASSMGLKLSDEDKQLAKEEAYQVFNYYSDDIKNYLGIDIKQLIKIMQEKSLRNKVYDEITKNYQISNADFEKYYQQYIDQKDNDDTEILSHKELENIYVNSMKDQIFESEYKKWSNDIVIEKNEVQWYKIQLYSFAN